MIKSFELGVVLRAIDHLTGPLRTAAGAIDAIDRAAGRASGVARFGADLESAGQRLLATGAAIGAAMAIPIAAMESLEDATTRARVAFMTRDGVDARFASIVRQAEDLGNLLPGSTADFLRLAAAMREAGIASEVIDGGALRATARFAALLNMDAESAARLTGTFRSALGIAQQDFPQLLDLVQRAKFAFGLLPQEFGDAVKYFGPIGKQLGLTGMQSARQVLALAGALSQAGIKGEQLGTSLRSTLNRLPELDRLVAKNADVAAILGRAGIQLRAFRNGQFVGLESLLGQLQQLQRLTPQARLLVLKELFGEESASTLATMVEKGTAGYAQALDVLERQASLDARVDEVLRSFRSQREATMGTLENAMAAIGASIAPDLIALMQRVNDAAAAFQRWAQEHPEAVRAIALTTVAVAGLLTTLGALAMVGGTLQVVALGLKGLALVIPILRGIRVALMFLSLGVRLFSGVLLTTPVGWVIAAVMAVIAALWLLWKHWDQIKAFFQGLWTWITGLFAGLGDWLRGIDWFDAGVRLVQRLWEGMKSIARGPIEFVTSLGRRLVGGAAGPAPDAAAPLARDGALARITAAAPALRRAAVAGAAVPALAAAAPPAIGPGGALAGGAGWPAALPAMGRVPSAAAPAASTTVRLDYRPTITIPGGALTARQQEELRALLAADRQQLLRDLQERLDGRTRTRY